MQTTINLTFSHVFCGIEVSRILLFLLIHCPMVHHVTPPSASFSFEVASARPSDSRCATLLPPPTRDLADHRSLHNLIPHLQQSKIVKKARGKGREGGERRIKNVGKLSGSAVVDVTTHAASSSTTTGQRRLCVRACVWGAWVEIEGEGAEWMGDLMHSTRPTRRWRQQRVHRLQFLFGGFFALGARTDPERRA